MTATNPGKGRPGDADRYRVLLDIGRTLAATLSEDELYEAIYRETARAVEASGFYIALHDPSRDLARVVFYADRGKTSRVDVAYRGSDSEVIRSREARLVKDGLGSKSPAQSTNAALMVLGDGSDAAVAGVTAPMIHHGRVLGAISAQSYRPGTRSRPSSIPRWCGRGRARHAGG